MRSKMNLKGHPLHPILVAFPIAFFIGAFVFDILGRLKDENSFHQTANYLVIAGLALGLLAAVPGIIDYFSIVPPKSSAKKRGAKHGILNVGLILIFGFSWYYRNHYAADINLILIVEAIGVVVLSISGWLGGTLVHRNQIGVDHRYAGAGKYKEKYFKDVSGEVEVMHSDELKTNQMMLIHINNMRIVIGKTDDEFVAFDDFCTHRGGSLADGAMICGTVQCPWHGSQFDCKTGMVKAGPAKKSIKTYSLREEANKVFLKL